ncbi:cyclodeaminase/cyclohydrolase family protein [Janthinobacterium lividum]|uniref:cyclodeaminase/cyclohydrolase family protein n=1 Tax=Janthinobacterium lividum TaxID=29581 RepID=UPI000FE24CC3
MQPPYLSHSTKALLDEFGAGKHIPGAGSASALSGLLAAQLVLTVCRLTLDKESHRDHHADLLAITQRLQFFQFLRLRSFWSVTLVRLIWSTQSELQETTHLIRYRSSTTSMPSTGI